MLKARVLAGLAGVLSAVLVASAQAPNPAALPENRDGARHKEFLKRADSAGQVDVLFIGDSITAGWEKDGKAVWAEKLAAFKPFNLGIGGDRTQHVIWRLTEGKEIEKLSPKAAVIMIGTNNISAGSTPEQIAGGIKVIIDELKKQKPKIKILLLGVFPRSDRSKKVPTTATEVTAADLQPKVKEINALIAKFDDGKTVKFLDIGDKFLDSKGSLQKKIMPDYLHLSEDGYKIWANAVEKPLQDLLAK